MFRRFFLLLCCLALSGCTAITTRPNDWARRTLHITPPPALVGSAEFERQLDRRSHSARTARNTATLLVDARETYPAMLAAIRGARRDINLSIYSFIPDRHGGEFIAALADAARRGARVRVIYDEVGSPGARRRDFAAITAAGGEVRVFNPFWHWTFFRYDHRAHRKILTVDGEVAFMGGLNIGDELTDWRDVMLTVRGEAVADAERVFGQTWRQAGKGWFGKTLPVLGATWLKNAVELPLKPFRQKETPLPSPPAPDAFLPTRVVEQVPDRLDTYLLNMFEYAVVSARKNVYLCTPYFVPPPRLARALRDAARRGVVVKVLTQGPTDIPKMAPVGKRIVADLLKNGVEVYAFQDAILHAKYMTVDGKWVTVGSANADTRSLILNYEANWAISDEALTDKFEQLFCRDLARSAPYAEYYRDLPAAPFYLRWLWRQF